MDEVSALVGKTSDEAKSSTKFFRAPLLWILFPQLAAYTLCECGFSFSSSASLLASGVALTASALACFGVFFRGKKHEFLREDLWTLCLPIAVFFWAGVWWSLQAPKAVDWRGRAETELVIDAEIETPFRSSGKSWSGLARVYSASDGNESLCGARIFYQFRKSETDTMPREGMRIRLRGIARDITNDTWLNADFREFLISKRANVLVGNGDCVEFLSTGTFETIRLWFAQQKEDLIDTLITPQSRREREQRILTAMLLGETSLLPREQQNDFMLTGTMHIFAVSGLHVSLFAGLFFALFSRVKLPYWSTAVATVFITLFYVLLTGAAPSAVRAWTMIVFLLASRLLGRNANPLNALVLSATVALWSDASLLASLGFQLSYGVVASIFLYGIPLGDYWRRRRIFAYVPVKDRTRIQRFLVFVWEKSTGVLAVSLGTFIAGAAFLAGTFEIFTPVAILVNCLLIPCTGVLLGVALVVAVFSRVPGMTWLAEILWEADCRLMFAVEVFTGTAAEFPVHFSPSFPSPWLGTLGGAIILTLFAFGAFWEVLRSRAWLRFLLPPVFLCLYLLAFAG